MSVSFLQVKYAMTFPLRFFIYKYVPTLKYLPNLSTDNKWISGSSYYYRRYRPLTHFIFFQCLNVRSMYCLQNLCPSFYDLKINHLILWLPCICSPLTILLYWCNIGQTLAGNIECFGYTYFHRKLLSLSQMRTYKHTHTHTH